MLQHDVWNLDTMRWEMPQPAQTPGPEVLAKRRKMARCACRNAANDTSRRLANMLAKRFGFTDCRSVD